MLGNRKRRSERMVGSASHSSSTASLSVYKQLSIEMGLASFQVRGMRRRLQPKSSEKLHLTVNRGTGVEVVINILEANFDVMIGEVLYKDYDIDPKDVRNRMCKHNVPIYYIARRAEGKRLFYYPSGWNAQCRNKKIDDVDTGAVYCLSHDHDLVRLFTHGETEMSNKTHHDGTVACKALVQSCLDCSINCSKESEKPECSRNRTLCYENYKAARCDCMTKACPCQMYVTNKCDSKKKQCVRTTFSKITLDPVFSSVYSYCHAKVLHLASYKIRTDLYLKDKLITSKLHRTIAKPHSSTVVDDYGYMIVKMPDPLRLDGKDFLLRRAKSTKNIEIGRLLIPSRNYNGRPTSALVFVPTKPFLINKPFWKKTSCDKININTIKAIDKYPLIYKPPEIFKKMLNLNIKEVAKAASDRKSKFSTFRVSKPNMQKFLDINMPKKSSVLRSIFPKSAVDLSRFSCKLVNKRAYWSIIAEGYLKSCPGSLTAKLYDREKSNRLLFYYDFAVTKRRRCYFVFEFNVPTSGNEEQPEKTYVLHLMTNRQNLKYVLVKERRIRRILPRIVIPKVDQRKLVNAIVPILAVASGLLFLLGLLVVFGAVTKPPARQIVKDSDFHFRHVFVIVWFVAARLAKSILFTITFISYIFVVIHSENYYTLKTYNDFQKREKAVFGNIFEDMENHRIAEIDRQNRRFIEEKNKCEVNLQRLDVYLSNEKRDAAWRQQMNKKYKSIKLSAVSRFEKNLKEARLNFQRTKKLIEMKVNYQLHLVKALVGNVKRKVIAHFALNTPRAFYKAYKAFGGSKNMAQYVGLEVFLNHLIQYVYRIQDSRREFDRFTQSMKRVRDNQKRSERLNFRAWKEQLLNRPPIPVPKLHSIRYRKNETTVKIDKNLIQHVLGVTWVINLIKTNLLKKVSTILMIITDALLFIYRHTRTYAMAVLMVHGFKKVYDLDKLKQQQEKEDELWLKRTHKLYHGYSPVAHSDEESNSGSDDPGMTSRKGFKRKDDDTSSTSSSEHFTGKGNCSFLNL